MRVLVIEDYLPLSSSLCQGLREAGYVVDSATDGLEGLRLAEQTLYDGIVLDLMLPGLDGLSVLTRVRQVQSRTPVLIITARDAIEERVRGLDLGADDYLVKPFAFQEFLARVRAIIRRKYQFSANTIRVEDLEIDTVARVVRRGGSPIELSAREYAVLEYLAVRRGHVVTRTEIWNHIYDFASEPASNVVDVYIGYLRKKLDRDPGSRLIRTRRGQGYVLGEPE